MGAVYWSPILVDPAGRIAGGNGDPLFIAYIVTWVAGHFGDAALWNPPFFHPATGVLAYSDHLLGLSAVAWPLVAAGASPIVIVNLLAILASVLTSAGALHLASGQWIFRGWSGCSCTDRHLQRLASLADRSPAAAVAGLFADRAALLRARDRGRAGVAWVWAGGAALALQTLFTPSLGVSLMPLAIVWLIAASLLARRTSLAYWVSVAGSIAIVGLVNLPIAVHYWRVGRHARPDHSGDRLAQRRVDRLDFRPAPLAVRQRAAVHPRRGA